ncbi:MAG TPA: FmdB family zinc ribbon protein [bacterium]|nr:FmdB family zinc ribbon protein [bacterium]
MPLYEYRCTACSRIFERHHEVGGSPGACPFCGGEPRRIFTSVGLIFKGSGFHTTDYRKAAGTGGNGADGAAVKDGTKESGKTDGGASTGSGTEAASKKGS